MQKEIKVSTTKRDDREVKYIKKYNKKLKILKYALLIIILIYVILVGRRTIIMSSLSGKATENKINDNVSPQPDYTIEVQSDNTIRLTVKAGVHKPYLYKSKAYKRNDTATIEVDTLEFSRLILEGKNIRFEELPCREQVLTFELLCKKLKESIKIDTFNKDTLKTLNLYSNENGYNNAAGLLADKN